MMVTIATVVRGCLKGRAKGGCRGVSGAPTQGVSASSRRSQGSEGVFESIAERFRRFSTGFGDVTDMFSGVSEDLTCVTWDSSGS